jgi:hypothetical protein
VRLDGKYHRAVLDKVHHPVFEEIKNALEQAICQS